MYVIYGFAELHLPYSHSLKEKRGLIQGVSNRLRKRFNISLAEVGYHDLWQRCRLGFSAVSHEMPTLELIMNSIHDQLDSYSDEIELLEFSFEIAKY